MSWYNDLLKRKIEAREAKEQFWWENRITPEQLARFERNQRLRRAAAEEYDLSPQNITRQTAQKLIDLID